jgi:predicted nucleic acid-binding protein
MSSKPANYWDACLFYEVLGDEPVSAEKKAAIQEILEANKRGDNIIITSVVTHLEVIPSKLNAKMADGERKYRAMFDGVHFIDYEINRNILMRAREIKDFYFRAGAPGQPNKVMDSADAVHLATATIYGVVEFHTRDDQDHGPKIPLVSLYKWSGIDKICGKYPLVIKSPEQAQRVMNLVQTNPTIP